MLRSVIGSLVVAALIGLGETTRTEAAPTREQIARWIQQLGDNDFAVREKASQLLWEAGKDGEAALRDALQSDDREVVRRVRVILDKFQAGIYPDTPGDIVDAIQLYQAGEAEQKRTAVNKLLDRGSSGCAGLLKLARAEGKDAVRKALLEQVVKEAARAVGSLHAEGKLDLLEQLFDLALTAEVATAPRSYAALQALRGTVDAKLEHWKALAARPEGERAAEVLTYLYRARGDLAKAREAAARADRNNLLEMVLFEQGDWKALAKLHDETGIADGPERLGFKAIYNRLAGNLGEFDKAVAALRKLADDQPEQTWNVWNSAKSLFINELPQDGINVALKAKRPAVAFEVLCYQLRYREALELADKSEGGSDRLLLMIRKARTLYQLGEKDRAREMFAVEAKNLESARDYMAAEQLVEMEFRLGLKDLAFQHAGRLAGLFSNEETLEKMLDKITYKHGATALVWWKFHRRQNANEEPGISMGKVRRMLEVTAADAAFAGQLQEVEQAAAKLPPVEREKWLVALGETGLMAERGDLAAHYLALAADLAVTPAPLVRLGDLQADKRRWADAAERYGQAWERDRKQPLPLLLRGLMLTRAGRENEGRPLMDLAHGLSLADDQARFDFQEALLKRGLIAAASREHDQIRRLGEYRSIPMMNVHVRMQRTALERKDYFRMAEYLERCMIHCLQARIRFIDDSSYLRAPYGVRHYRAWAWAAAGKLEECKQEMDWCLSTVPGEVSFATHLVPELAKHMQAKEADQLYERIRAIHEKVSKDHPTSALAHNRLASLALGCKRDLDRALERAQRAVEMDDQNVHFWDTLAEVHFQRGSRDKAIEVMKKCIRLEPRRDYYRQQLRRFEAGDRNADLPMEFTQ